MPKPKINPVRTLPDVFLEAFAFSSVVYLVAYLVFNYTYLPEDLSVSIGTENSVLSGKSITILLAVIAVSLYVVITVLNNYPHILNYPVKITRKNARKQYQLAKSFNSYLKLFIGILILIIQAKIISNIWNYPSGPEYLMYIFIFIGIFVPLSIYLYLSKKYNKINGHLG